MLYHVAACRLPLAACRLPLAACILLLSPLNLAQTDTDTVVSTEDVAAAAEEDDDIEEVVVTGSRIRRDAFSSAAPVQIIQGASKREVGLIDTAAILQGATQASGQQVDSTWNGFVLDNGAGSAQVSLRGLGAGRTLVLMNSRRLASAGVGGAPTSADTSLIPSVMVDRYELLLDGASSIYGSDAVAGVVNVIMRTDFEGWDFEAQINRPNESGGEQSTFGLAWGGSGDQWDLGVGAEYYERKVLRFGDRSFSRGCNEYNYTDRAGNRLSEFRGLAPGTTPSSCKLDTTNRIIINTTGSGFGNLWATPGFTNIGIPGFSETTVPLRFRAFNPGAIIPIDANGDGRVDNQALVDPDGDGLADVDIQAQPWQFANSDRRNSGDFYSPTERFNLYAYGNYDLEDESNTSIYFETLYSQRDSTSFSPGSQFFPDVPDSNPYNPCGADARARGQNCRAFYGVPPETDVEIIPVVYIRGDRENYEAEIKQLNVTAGIKGDLLSWQNDSGFGNWGYDIYLSYGRSKGKDQQEGILDPEIKHSLETSAIHSDTGEIVCGVDADMDGNPDGTDPWGNACVPINMFAEAIYQSGGGTFATQAERDYLFGVRGFDKTQVDLTVLSGIIQGDLFNLPWNNTTVDLVLGLEYRKDEIDSQPNIVARDGLFFGFFADRGAKGSRTIQELFFETELHLLEDVRFADELTLNLAARYTDESTYGSDLTYSVKAFYRANSIVTLRATYGTSFRAPNAREQFLLGTSGFNNVRDFCVVPEAARSAALIGTELATYNPARDYRTPAILDNCRANGVDPLTLGLQGELPEVYSVEIFQKGGEQVRVSIDPETSVSKTYGIVFDVPYWDELTLRLGLTYFEIIIEDTILRRSGGNIVYECLVEGRDDDCSFFERDADGALDVIDSSYININARSAHGMDYNLYAERDFILSNDRNLNVSLDATASRLLEDKYHFETSSEDDARTPITAEWEAQVDLTLRYSDFRFRWTASYISSEDESRFYADEDDNGFDLVAPCDGLGVLCRPYHKTTNYVIHGASLSWQPQDWSFTLGMRNLFAKEPPRIDSDAPESQINNLPLGGGYDLLGRRVFLSARRSL